MLQDMYNDVKEHQNPLHPDNEGSSVRFKFPEESFTNNNTFVVQEKYFRSVAELQASYKFLRAGTYK